MKLDIDRVKKVHGFLLPQNEPSIPQNTRRREQASILLATYEQKVNEQTRFELNLGVSTGRLSDILQPRVIAPTLPGPGGAANVLELANRYAGHHWPTATSWGQPLKSGMTSPAADAARYANTFNHLGMLPESYEGVISHIGYHEHYMIDNNKAPSKLFSSTLKKAEWQITLNLAIDEARTSYAYHINKVNDESRTYLHMDFIYRDNTSPDQFLRFIFPENEEQKAIWRNVFWGEHLPQFPIIPEVFAVPKSPSLTPGSSSAEMQRQSENLLAGELSRLQIQPQNSARGGSSKDPFFM